MPRLAVLALFLVLAGCGGATSERDAVLLTGSSWTVERIVYPTGEVVRGDGETVAFGADGSVSLSSCNTCTGRYESRRGGVTIDANRCTRRACSPGTIELERFVSGEQSVERDGPYLILTAVPSEEREAGEPAQVLLLPTEAPQQTAP